MTVLHDRVTEQMRVARNECVRVAAMMLLVEPGGDPRALEWCGVEIGDALRLIPYVGKRRTAAWLREAGINPWRRCGDLSVAQKRALADQMRLFLRDESA